MDRCLDQSRKQICHRLATEEEDVLRTIIGRQMNDSVLPTGLRVRQVQP